MLFDETNYPQAFAALLGNLCSMALDFVARHKVGGTHLNFFIYKQLPILSPATYAQTDLTYIVPRVLELTYTSHSLAAWAAELGHDGPPFPFDPDRRAVVRAELDAYFAKLYGLTRDELRYILDPADTHGQDYPTETFRGLKANELRQYGEYRTRRLVLEAWDQLENRRTVSMLLDLTLTNFKIWKTTGLVKLAPVSLLLGTNSSGKSSIIQSLLLIRQTVRSNDPNISLNFGSEDSNTSVALGQFSDVLHRIHAEKEIGINFTWTPTADAANARNFSAVYQPTRSDAAEIKSLRLGKAALGFTVTRSSKGAYRLTVGAATKPLGSSREYHPQSSFTFSPATFSKMLPDDARLIREAGTALLDELAKIIYLGRFAS